MFCSDKESFFNIFDKKCDTSFVVFAGCAGVFVGHPFDTVKVGNTLTIWHKNMPHSLDQN